MSRRLVVGIGNADRGDDAAGLAVAARLERVRARDFDVVRDDGDVGRLLDWFATYDEIHVVDALCDGAPDRSARRWNALAGALPANLSGTSSHVLGLAQAIELARALERLPHKLVVHGVPGRNFRMGDAMSAEALRAVDEAVAAIAAGSGRGSAPMHEAALMKEVVAKVLDVARRESSPRVVRVRVRLGALSHFTPSHFVEHFRESTRGTLADGAEVDIDVSEDRTDPLAREVVLESVMVQER